MAKKSKNKAQDTVELEQAFYDLAPPAEKIRPRRRRALFISLCVLLAVLITGLALLGYFFYQINTATILEHVSVAGVDVGGMTKEQALNAVKTGVGSSYDTTDMIFEFEGTRITIPAAYAGGTPDLEGAVTAAVMFGNVGLPSALEEQQAAAAAGYTVDLTPYMELDEERIRQLLAPLEAQFSHPIKQTTYTVEGDTPTEKALADGTAAQKLIITLGIPEYSLDINSFYRTIIDGYNRCDFHVKGRCATVEPDPIDLQGIYEAHHIASQDAYMDPETYRRSAHRNGWGFDITAAEKAVAEAPYGTTVTVDFAIEEPSVTTAQLMEELFGDTLSTATAKSSSQWGRDDNLKLACEALNGLIVNPGESISYNDVLGERTTEKGYKAGASYSGGKTVYTVGGGICQVSSTLYYALLLADLEIVRRDNHGFAASYLPLGVDATVSWGGPDFVFRNNSSHPILIEAYADGGHTTVTLKGIDDKSYYVEIESIVLKKIDWKTEYESMKADNPDGYKDGDEIISPYTGYEVKTYRCKYDKATKQQLSRQLEAYSYYSHRDKVVAKIENALPPQPGIVPTEPPTATDPSEPSAPAGIIDPTTPMG